MILFLYYGYVVLFVSAVSEDKNLAKYHYM